MAGTEYDPWSAVMADEPTAQQMALARAAALRGQNFAGMVAGLAHEPGLQRQGPELMQQAQQGMEQLGALPQARLQRAMEMQRMQQQGPQEALGGQTPSVFEALTKREAVPKFAATYPGAQIYNQKTGELGPAPAGGSPGLLDPAALDQAAEMFNTTGKLPPGIMRGPAGAMIGRQIANRAAELHPNASLAGNQANYKADTGSQANQQKILDNTESWERTGKANLGVLLGVAQKLKDTGSPWLNQPVRTFIEKGIGDPNQTAFKAAHATVVNEYAKILSGSQGSGGVTEGARHEAESMLPLNATWEQLTAAAQILNTDAGNRIASLRQQMVNIKGRTSGAPAATETPSPLPGGPPPGAALSERDARMVQIARDRLKANPNDATAQQVLKLHGLQ